MRYVITRLQGAGTDLDPLRAPFPSYTVVAGPFGAPNLVLITVPDEDCKQEDGADVIPDATLKLSAWLAARGVPQPRIDAAVAQYGDPDVIVTVTPAMLTRWKARLDRRYREKAGGYNIGVG